MASAAEKIGNVFLESIRADLIAMVNEIMDERLAKESQPDLMTLEQVSELMQATPVTVRSWIKTKGFPGNKAGSVWRFERAKVVAWLKEQTTKPGTNATRLANQLTRAKAR
jgi:excisionase family DNA binding protein